MNIPMSARLRVRVKAFEDIPDTLKCCEASNVEWRKHAGDIYEVMPDPLFSRIVCKGCGNRIDKAAVLMIGYSLCVFVDSVDIDEGGAV